MRTVVITQSNYIPWKGYFDLINMADELILFDSVQYTRRDWRNRNKIKTPNGTQWLTIPVLNKGKYGQQAIHETEIKGTQWRKEHWKSIKFNYARSPYFEQYAERFKGLYLDSEEENLSQVNYVFLKTVCDILEIDTKISWSMDYGVIEGKTERLIDLCHKANGDTYLSGPAARDYMDEDAFADADIQVQYMNYDDYREYEQLFPPFVQGVSVLDLLFNTGDNARDYMKSFTS
ncbi:MAG: WbqC family protein [Aggregatilineales bacterium]